MKKLQLQIHKLVINALISLSFSDSGSQPLVPSMSW